MEEYKIENRDKRIEWIDSLRAFAIFCIVLGHALNGYSLVWHWVYGFHVPLFLVLAGLTYSYHYESIGKFVWKKAKSILVPYYIFGIISIVIYMIIGTKIDGKDALTLKDCLKGLIWANGETGIMRWNLPLWYLPVFFTIQVIAYCVYKTIKSEKQIFYVFFAASSIGCVIYGVGFLSNLPYGIETVCYLFPFFLLGIILRNQIKKIKSRFDMKVIILAILLISFSTFIILSQDNIDYVWDDYRIYPFFLAAAAGMSSGLILLASRFPVKSRMIGIIGRNTLGIMVMQKFPLVFFEYVCPGIKNIYFSNRGIASLIISILSIVLCTAASIVLEIFAPWMIGRKDRIDETIYSRCTCKN